MFRMKLQKIIPYLSKYVIKEKHRKYVIKYIVCLWNSSVWVIRLHAYVFW